MDGPSGKSGGVILGLKHNIPFSKIDNIFAEKGALESVGITLNTNINPLHIISIYRHPESTSDQIWINLLNSLPKTNNLVITGDFNSHHTSWDSSHSDKMGKLLFDATTDQSIFCINDGTPTFLSRPQQAISVIDE